MTIRSGYPSASISPILIRPGTDSEEEASCWGNGWEYDWLKRGLARRYCRSWGMRQRLSARALFAEYSL